MKKLIAIAIVAILFTGAAMAQVLPTIAPATGKFSLNAYCNATLTKTADVDWGYISIPQSSNTAYNGSITFKLTGNSTGVNGKFDVAFTATTSVTSIAPGTGDLTVAGGYARSYDQPAGTPINDINLWDGHNLTNISTRPVTGGTPCTGEATFTVTINSVNIPATVAPGAYEFPFSVTVTQHI